MGQEQPLAGKVAFITGAARGQGRSHAVELARRGARILAMDICEDIDSVPYGLATADDLQQTVAEVEAVGGDIVAVTGDVREPADVAAAVDACRERFGVPDIVVANAGINSQRGEEPDAQQAFVDTIMVNLVGVWNTVHAIAPLMIERARAGRSSSSRRPTACPGGEATGRARSRGTPPASTGWWGSCAAS